MRSAIAFFLVSGQAWFAAGALAASVAGLDAFGFLRNRPRARVAARLTFLLALGLGTLSGTPVLLWLLVPLGLAIGGVLGTGFRAEPSRASRVFEGALVAMAIVAMATEARWHRMPDLGARIPSGVLVLGDSLSSGGFGESAAWPARLERRVGVPVRSVASPSETVSGALENQAAELGSGKPGSVVVLEIGGNDLLGGRPLAEFERDLDALLAVARRSPAGAVVMFELPVPPGRWRWGAAQRRLARRHGVAMIPKRVLARLVTTPELVGDGLHPTDEGHAMLAREVARLWR